MTIETFHLGRPQHGNVRAAVLATVCAAFFHLPQHVRANSQIGGWSGIYGIPTLPIHTNVLPNGKILIWQHGHFDGIDPLTGKKYVKDNPQPIVWDPNTQTSVSVEVPDKILNIQTDEIYCSGQTILLDGQVAVTGGHSNRGETEYHGSPRIRLFDYKTNTWSLGEDMNAGRWYPTNLPLADGTMLVMGGFVTEWVYNNIPQIFNVATKTWRTLENAALEVPLYPWLYRSPNGKIFCAGPGSDTRFLDTTIGQWSQTAIPTTFGSRTAPGAFHRATSVLYAEGKIMNLGGTPADWLPPTNAAEVIDLNMGSPAWRQVAPMNYGRQYHNATLLPDGKVLVTGGSMGAGFNDYSAKVLAAEMWDPAAETWTVMASHAQPRLHHAVALLLPDGRVMVGGGGQTGMGGEIEYRNVEFYSPPYLFKGARPTITSAPEVVAYGQSFSVETVDKNINRVVLIRLPSVTHGFNQNQGFSKLTFGKGKNGLTVFAPVDRNAAPPGHYMLFILDGKGVPSVAKIVRLG